VAPSVDDLFSYMTPDPTVTRLPSKVRRNRRMAEILHEHYILGVSAERIAEERHVSASTIRTALRQGLHLLRLGSGVRGQSRELVGGQLRAMGERLELTPDH
jgi:hypothetical protein